MADEDLDGVAQALHDAWAREYHGGKVKWVHIGPEERSVWRHVARVAEAAIKGDSAAKSKPAVAKPLIAKPVGPPRRLFPPPIARVGAGRGAVSC